MKRVEGCADVKLMECVSPAKDKWRIRWDIQPQSDGSANYMEAEFCHKPSEEEIKQTIVGWFNSEVDATILSGFEWNGMKVWLSSENQFNYKAAYDLAVQTAGQTLPVTFKFGNEEPCYYTFDTVEVLTDFYTKAMLHIQHTLSDSWKKKDAFDIEQYR